MATWHVDPFFPYYDFGLPLGLVCTDPHSDSSFTSLDAHESVKKTLPTRVYGKPVVTHFPEWRSSSGHVLGYPIRNPFVEPETITVSPVRNIEYRYAEPFSQETLAAIVSVPCVQRAMNPNRFLREKIYVVCGVRIVTEEFIMTYTEPGMPGIPEPIPPMVTVMAWQTMVISNGKNGPSAKLNTDNLAFSAIPRLPSSTNRVETEQVVVEEDFYRRRG